MKNYIPLVLAVLLGLAAVLAVTRMIRSNRQAPEEESWVVAAQRDLKEGDVLQVEALLKKVIPVSARPADAIVWSKRSLVVGQTLRKRVSANDYLLLPDIGMSKSLASLVGEGEWAVPLSVGNTAIGRNVQPGDEVAVIATFPADQTVTTKDATQQAQKVTKTVTLVLFPRVRVLESITSSGRGEGGGDIILALPPQQAQTLIAAQGKAQLTVALRRPGDGSALSRVASGMVDDSVFDQLLNQVKPVSLPDASAKTQ
ncbi:MAG: Flp pilus assembly protein CpaB [Verrucomicrobiota bacterium]